MLYVYLFGAFMLGVFTTIATFKYCFQRFDENWVWTELYLTQDIKVCREFMDYCYPKG